jgi:hypothetical protein
LSAKQQEVKTLKKDIELTKKYASFLWYLSKFVYIFCYGA